MKTIVISAFPGCGKTRLTKAINELGIDCKAYDSDSSEFSWADEAKTERNPDFPGNYIERIAIISNNTEVATKIILVSSHQEVRAAMDAVGLDYWIVAPSVEMKDIFIKRFYERGSSEQFVNTVSSNWTTWIEQLKNQPRSDRFIALTADKPYLSAIIDKIVDLS